MATVNEMIEDILKKEGGYVNHKADKGGPSNFGITQNTYSKYINRPATVEDIKNIKKHEAYEIYATQYFFKPKINMLPIIVQPIIFDISVNSGPKKAIKMLQEVLNQLGYSIGVIDGIIGNKTVLQTERAYETIGPNLIKDIVNRRLAFYRNIVKKDPTQKVFLAGWEARATSFLV